MIYPVGMVSATQMIYASRMKGKDNTVGKLKSLQNGDSVIDSAEWQRFLTAVENKLDELIFTESLIV